MTLSPSLGLNGACDTRGVCRSHPKEFFSDFLFPRRKVDDQWHYETFRQMAIVVDKQAYMQTPYPWKATE